MCPGVRAVKNIGALLALSVALEGWPARLEAASAADVEADEHVTAPVVLDGVTLLRVRGVSALPAQQRASRIASRRRPPTPRSTPARFELPRPRSAARSTPARGAFWW